MRVPGETLKKPYVPLGSEHGHLQQARFVPRRVQQNELLRLRRQLKNASTLETWRPGKADRTDSSWVCGHTVGKEH
jgi:hypothetical protein